MKSKWYKVFMAFALIALLALAACGNDEEEAGSDSNSGGETEENESGSSEGEEKTIEFMHLWPEGSSKQHYEIVESIIDQYETDNPNVTVEVEILGNEQYKEKLKVLSTSNELPDVGMTWAAGFLEPYVSGNMFASLDDLLEGPLNDQFVPGTAEAYALEGTTYGLPLELNITPLYYNKAIFDEHGLEAPETLDEFKEVVKTLVDNGVTPIALGNKDRWTGSMWYMYLADRFGGPEVLTNAINRSGTFEDPALVEAAEEIKNLVEMDAFLKGFNGLGNDEAKGYFINEQAAMYLMGTWDLPEWTTNEDNPQEFRDSIEYMKFPTVEGGQGDIDSFVGGPGVGLFVAEDSDVQAEAKEFVSFFVEQWGQQAVTKAGVIPATKVDTEGTDLPQMYIDILNDLNDASNITLFADVQMSPSVAEVHLDMIQALFGDAATPEEFASEQEQALADEE
ncbi:extracellular solute-binding protein [Saliterribacillus persicus]|uniref:Carbohydrate ABC transporter substrate-binding protein (CUT1 family) n=1 Tax=Saliterribacillus persicus TaxID=930114 RepID=A0A368X8G1_9BACI|nr:extracellular solute-binding protein [Saliterribacillus persicus]RCW64252.1 carbohydrate ABC transporter substrate-binding protein (CUT1 family) [Saliterribacillus persicus]